MEYTYMLASGDLRILTPGVASLADVKNEILEHTEKKITRRSVYPNGFEITVEQFSSMIFLHCNQPLTENPDGSFTAPTDK